MSSPPQSPRSSRTSTPASNSQTSPTILSPRSKIRALLAPFDEDSDDDTPHQPTTISIPAPKPATSRPLPTRVNVAFESDDDEDEAPVAVPRGRLAARMAGLTAPKEKKPASSEEDDDSHNVYQRIRQQMIEEKMEMSNLSTVQDKATAADESRHETPSPPRRRLVQRLETLPARASARSESPGLFMSPGPAISERDNDSDSDSPLPDQSRLRELVERRRKERLAKEAAQRDADEEHAELGGAPLSDLFNDEDDDVDLQTEQRLASSTRPTRKASKKALEEMNRETQRLSRNMQLVHQAKVKKRFTTADFLTRFNKPKTQSPLVTMTTATISANQSSSSAAPSSDGEASKQRDTPPSSPPSEHETGFKMPSAFPTATVPAPAAEESDGEDLPTLDEVVSTQATRNMDGDKAPAHIPAPELEDQVVVRSVKTLPKNFRIVPPTKMAPGVQSDSDDDLEIVPNRFPVFDSIPAIKASESRSIFALRRLAHLNAPEKTRLKKGEKPSMTPAQLELQLRHRAKLQADEERREKLESLRARGVVILTEEEREKEQLAFEDLLGRARRDAAALRAKEKAADKANGVEEKDMLASDDESEDEDYAGSDEGDSEADNEEEEDVELSGSEEEDETMAHGTNGLVDDEAGENSEGSAGDEDEVSLHAGSDQLHELHDNVKEAPQQRKPRRTRRVVEDDDDDEDEDETAPTQTVHNIPSHGINDDLAAAFGFGPLAVPRMGVSQMFAGTMAESQTQADSQMSLPDTMPQDEDSMDVFRYIPSAPVPTFEPSILDDSQDAMVADSQGGATQPRDYTQQVELNFAPSVDSPSMAGMSQLSDIPDPSQDVGLGLNRTPINFKVPPSTVETVILPVPESPIAQKRGRLLRRSEAGHQADNDSQSVASPVAAAPSNVFDVMRKAASNPAEPDFDKKKSDARNMVEEQAEESEDEYAGLGGASDDEGADVADEADRQMIDESDIKVDERQLAAYYAEKARAQDEAQTSKLYKDLVSGALRRKRTGGAFDLDSDEDEQIVERRRRKQREEARKRRLLLQDESVGKLGGNNKKEAFLRAIEDKDEDDELDLLDGQNIEEEATVPDSQNTNSQETGTQQPLTQVSGNALKRKHTGEDSNAEGSRRTGPASIRRSPWDSFRKPVSFAEVRESVSFLIDEPHGGDAHHLSDLEDEDDEQQSQRETTSAERAPFAERRTMAKADIIDRLTLKRISSTADSAEGSALSKLAFAAPVSRSSISSFKTPSLLRRATTSLSTTDAQSMPPPALLNREDSAVRRGGSKKSSINYQAREAERRVVVERAERKRQQNVRKIAGMRREGALGLLKGMGAGFE